MIVRACDTCRKLIVEGAAISASRSGTTIAFSRAGAKAQSHFCDADCAVTFFERWLGGQLEEPVLPPVEAQANAAAQPARPHTVSGVREPTAEERAAQAALLGMTLGGR